MVRVGPRPNALRVHHMTTVFLSCACNRNGRGPTRTRCQTVDGALVKAKVLEITLRAGTFTTRRCDSARLFKHVYLIVYGYE